MLTSLAVVLVGIWLVIQSQQPVSSTLTLIFGIAVAALALIDVLRGSGYPLTRRGP